MILAQTDLTWSAVVGVFGFLVLVFTLIEKARKALGTSPEKREISFAEEFATKKEFEEEKKYAQERRKAIYEKFERMSQENAAQFTTLRKDIKDDFDGVHGRVTEVVECLGELRGEVKQALKDNTRRMGL